jgi:hypothetical protein
MPVDTRALSREEEFMMPEFRRRMVEPSMHLA